jgi:uncharacterized protein
VRLAIVCAIAIATRLAVAAPTTSHPLDDAAHLIDSTDEVRIESQLRELRTAGVDMAVIIVQHTGSSIESYARDAAHDWATGRGAAAVLVLAIGDRKSRLEVSDPLRTKFPDHRAQAILDNARGYLRSADYAGAVHVIINEVSAAHRGVAADLESPHPQSNLPATTPATQTPSHTPSTAASSRPPKRSHNWLYVLGGSIVLLGFGALWAASSRKAQFTLSHDGAVNTLQRSFVVDWLWHTVKIMGWAFFILFVILSAMNNSKASSSSWGSSNHSSSSTDNSFDWGSSSSSSSSSTTSSSSGGGWSGGGASSGW